MNTWNEMMMMKPDVVGGIGANQAQNIPLMMYNENNNPATNGLLLNHALAGPGHQQQMQTGVANGFGMLMSGSVSSGLRSNHSENSNDSQKMTGLMMMGEESMTNGDDEGSGAGGGSGGGDDDDDDDDCDSSVNDAEGVWSPDIEQSFQEALAIYPPCGRRKIILSEEGKMYGRNELIARYIKVRTGKSRSRKQVSSHIQVLAKRKTKDFQNHVKCTDFVKDPKDGKPFNPFSNLTSAQIISPAPISLPPAQQNLIIPNLTSGANNGPSSSGKASSNGNTTSKPGHQTNRNMNGSISQMGNTQSSQQQSHALLPLGNNNNATNHLNNHSTPPQLLQNCTNIMQNNVNLPQHHLNNHLMQQSSHHHLHHQQSSSIWAHPGLEKGMPGSSTLPSSLNSGDDLLPISGSSSGTATNNSTQMNNGNNNSTQNNENIRHTAAASYSQQQPVINSQTSSNNNNLSPGNNNNWPSVYSSNNNNSLVNIYNRCIAGLNQLRFIEFSGFLEKRRDPEIYQKHLFVHLNMIDYLSNQGSPSNGLLGGNSAGGDSSDLSLPDEDLECINYKEFADKFPENDLHYSVHSSSNYPALAQANVTCTYLVKFWVDLNYVMEEGVSALYAVTNLFESPEPMTVSCSTKVCSFGNQVVEKVETEQAQYENGRYVYRFENSPMCEYMVSFVNKLKQLPDKNSKNQVLENFSVLQLIKNHDTKELLLTLAYVFEVSTSEHGAQHVIYRLTK